MKNAVSYANDVAYIDLDVVNPSSVVEMLMHEVKEKTSDYPWSGYPKIEDYERVDESTGEIFMATMVTYANGLSVKFKKKMDPTKALLRALDVLIKDTKKTLSSLDPLLTDPKG